MSNRSAARRAVAQRVQKHREGLRAAGLRPVQICVPDTRAPGFAEECRRQTALMAAADRADPGIDGLPSMLRLRISAIGSEARRPHHCDPAWGIGQTASRPRDPIRFLRKPHDGCCPADHLRDGAGIVLFLFAGHRAIRGEWSAQAVLRDGRQGNVHPHGKTWSLFWASERYRHDPHQPGACAFPRYCLTAGQETESTGSEICRPLRGFPGSGIGGLDAASGAFS